MSGSHILYNKSLRRSTLMLNDKYVSLNQVHEEKKLPRTPQIFSAMHIFAYMLVSVSKSTFKFPYMKLQNGRSKIIDASWWWAKSARVTEKEEETKRNWKRKKEKVIANDRKKWWKYRREAKASYKFHAGIIFGKVISERKNELNK